MREEQISFDLKDKTQKPRLSNIRRRVQLNNLVKAANAPLLKLHQPTLILQDRDFEILRFCLEMKFASAIQIHQKFFRTTKAGSISVSVEWCERRLRSLEQAGYLRALTTPLESRYQYLATAQAYGDLGLMHPYDLLPRPQVLLDHRIFQHDKEVINHRLQLEARGDAKEWISDRVLTSGRLKEFAIPKSFTPDGIYKSANGEWTAFELEIGRKTQAQYKAKIEAFVEAIRAPEEGQKKFARVSYLCLRQYPFGHLKRLTELYGDLFHVEFRPIDERERNLKRRRSRLADPKEAADLDRINSASNGAES